MIALTDIFIKKISFHTINHFDFAFVRQFLRRRKRLHNSVIRNCDRRMSVLFRCANQRFDGYHRVHTAHLRMCMQLHPLPGSLVS